MGNWSTVTHSQFAFGGHLFVRTLLAHCSHYCPAPCSYITIASSPLHIKLEALLCNDRGEISPLTLTILAHWVPFPAPGPPRTNITQGLAIPDIMRSLLQYWRNMDVLQTNPDFHSRFNCQKQIKFESEKVKKHISTVLLGYTSYYMQQTPKSPANSKSCKEQTFPASFRWFARIEVPHTPS